MPHHKSAKKRLKQSKARRLRNREDRGAMRSALKDFRQLIGSGQEVDWQRELSGVASMLDIQVRKGIIHRNKAARLKSRLAGQVPR